MTAHTDLIKLSGHYGGRIPSQIPDHYVAWVRANHYAARKARHATETANRDCTSTDGLPLVIAESYGWRKP